MTISELEAKIEHSRTMRDKFIQMRPLLKDKNVISDCDTQIKEYQKYIDYFTEELHRLEAKQQLSSSEEKGYTSSTAEQAQQKSENPPRSSSMPPGINGGTATNTTAAIQAKMGKKKYSNLDLLMSETPYNKPKVSLKLHELEYKLDVEKTVLKGIKGMFEVMERNPSADRRNRTELQDKMFESQEKLTLLNSALRKYKSLYIGEGGDEDEYELETLPSARLPPGYRRPVTGKLQLQILEAMELAHAPTRMIKSPSTVVIVKVDNQIAYRSRQARNDKWSELCETHVNKASEIEISIYDQSTEKSLPIGFFWLKITDITEGLRKRKLQPQWMPAEEAQKVHRDVNEGLVTTETENAEPAVPVQADQNENGIEAWFDVEPVGKLALRLNFVRSEGNRRPMDKLGRAGAVRQRREEVVEVNGHQFVEKRFYNVMKCGLCEEFFVNSGFQCEDCEYTCHKRCSSKVVTKCMVNSKDNVSDEDKLNHKIPHRFEPITNIGANWCCHCGYILPLGSRGAKKCSECDITAHRRCEHYVPDFCGLNMEMANQMLAEIKAAARRKTDETKSQHNSKHDDSDNTAMDKEDAPLPVPSHESDEVPNDIDDRLSTQLLANLTLPSHPTSTKDSLNYNTPVNTTAQVPADMYNAGPNAIVTGISQRQQPQSPAYQVSPTSPQQHLQQSPSPMHYQSQPQSPSSISTINVYTQQQQQHHLPASPHQHRPPPILPTHGQQFYSPQHLSNPRFGAPPNPHYYQQQQVHTPPHPQTVQQQYQNRPLPSLNAHQHQQQLPYPHHPMMLGRPPQQSAPIINPNYASALNQQRPAPSPMQQPIPFPPGHQPHYNNNYNNMIMGMPPPGHQLQKHPSLLQQQQLGRPLLQNNFNRKVALDNFTFLAVLGKGNFGKVMLAEDKYDKKLYAIKMLKKRFIIDNDEIESVRSEKRVFQAANHARHPFLINLHSTFQTETRVYFTMEYIEGGDLMWHIQRGQFSERRAKFYACEVLLALEYFHSQNIIYRDLKLDNIMLGLDGHIKIADYGLCKENMGYGNTTGTFCGTPEFMAPEILREQKYGRAVDWWAYGVLIYEMLLGQSPFRGEDEDEIFDAILEDDILYPINMSSDSISICQQLLQRDPTRRLGGGPEDSLSIKQHPFFRGVNWDDMLAKRVPPPFYPSVTGRLDTSNFDEEFTNEVPALTPIDSNLTRIEQQEFLHFSYIAEWAK
ncbi:hypothetical protein BDF20DRAFT_503174 [Mycotypha africana]|uniref:uncharacterized protein n=1 Tax=Mycotypha africana TaxID=64632 RepID=UPI0022FFC79A|nr:uncharacterized protein BDF20DRAFT_503174 [Mycotypha africana]KAI8979406.1 hypothetical protein BDF20DRAFT_503174 [Mycotypha africana]